jgi:hypothetical protein
MFSLSVSLYGSPSLSGKGPWAQPEELALAEAEGRGRPRVCVGLFAKKTKRLAPYVTAKRRRAFGFLTVAILLDEAVVPDFETADLSVVGGAQEPPSWPHQQRHHKDKQRRHVTKQTKRFHFQPPSLVTRFRPPSVVRENAAARLQVSRSRPDPSPRRSLPAYVRLKSKATFVALESGIVDALGVVTGLARLAIR